MVNLHKNAVSTLMTIGGRMSFLFTLVDSHFAFVAKTCRFSLPLAAAALKSPQPIPDRQFK
jgi:hypothetical protein